MKAIGAPARSSTGVAPERKPEAKKIVAIIGAESAAGLGLARAIVEDLSTEFVARAIVRSLDSAESRTLSKLGTELSVADPRDESALTRVLGGAYGAFYIQLSSEHPSPETKLATAHAVARAAKGVGLRHVIWATLEDPGQTFLEHNDVTPTFQNGRWMSDGEGQPRPEQIFTEMAIPTTFLHTAWEATIAAGKWTEDIGKHAYGLLRDRDSIGQTVSISAARMIRRPTPAPVPMPATTSEPVTVPSLATLSSTTSATTSSSAVRAFAVPASLPPVDPARAPANSRKTAMIGLVVAGVLAGMVVMRQVQSHKIVPAPDPIASPRAAEAVRPPPGAVKEPEAQAMVPPPVTAPPPVAASAEAPPPPAEVAPPAEMVVETNEHAAGKRNVAGKNHRRLASKTGAVASAASPPPAAPDPPAVAPVKAEAPKIEAPPERAAPTAPAIVADRGPAPKPAAVAPSVKSPPMAPAAPQPGFVDPKAVNLIVRSHADEANACYERALMEHPDLHGRLTIHAVIDPNGRVASASPTSSISDGARLQSCLVRAFRSWAFPQPSGGVNGNVTYSFSFEAP
jgi:hypothetical protein